MCELKKGCIIKEEIELFQQVLKNPNGKVCFVHRLQLAREIIAETEEELVELQKEDDNSL